MKTTLKALRLLALLPLAAGVAASGPALAQDAAAPADPKKVEREAKQSVARNPHENYLSFSYENDLIGDGKDRYYTNGVRMTYFNVNTVVPDLIDDAAKAIPGFDINATTGTYFTLGQNLYTPSDIRPSGLMEGDRPYAAWLYGSIGLATLTEDHIDDVELTLGVVGPEALGEQTQKFIHTYITGSPIPQGGRTNWNSNRA